MPTYEQVLTTLDHWFSAKQATSLILSNLRPQSFIDEDDFERRRKDLQEEIRRCDRSMQEVLQKLDRWPHRHMRHFERLQEFLKEASYDDSVFVMTKYPDDGDPAADRLQAVIDCLTAGIKARKYHPRVAVDKAHHRWMWDNIELYLLGCARGIAVVEDKYVPELNPNVAMEWGWMAGMGREVLFLREQGFKHERADWKGLISFDFDWESPQQGINDALDAFLQPR
jgi:hypothetical protein